MENEFHVLKKNYDLFIVYFSILENIPSLLRSFILIASKFSFANNLVDSMYKCLSQDECLNKCEESWDVLARRHLTEENKILEKCKETGQVAGK